jgi:hypothetical protein
LQIVNPGKKDITCDGPLPFEPLSINGGTLADGTTYTFNTPSTLIDLGQGTIEHGNSESLIVTFSGPVDFRFTSAAANSSRTVWHGNGNTINSTATSNGSAWCYNEGSVTIPFDFNGNVVSSQVGFSGVNANADWGNLESYRTTEVDMFAYIFDAYNYEARPLTGVQDTGICEVIGDLSNKLKVALQASGGTDTNTTSAIRQDLVNNTIEHDDGDGNVTTLNLEKYCYTLVSFEWEENGALSNNAFEWSVGNGSNGRTNIVVPVDSEIVYATFSSEFGGTSVSINILVNDVTAQTPLFTGQHDAVTLATPLTLTAGQRVGIQTGTETGAYTDARVALFIKMKVPD